MADRERRGVRIAELERERDRLRAILGIPAGWVYEEELGKTTKEFYEADSWMKPQVNNAVRFQ